jgi:hypothetical protein
MLGIELPTGSGSLSETSGNVSLFGQALIGGLDMAPMSNRPGAIGSNTRGIQPIGAPQPIGAHQPIGAPVVRSTNSGFAGGVGSFHGENNNDMALLQSLLPGVNITSGNTYRSSAQQHLVGVGGLNQSSNQWIGGNNNAGTSQEQQRRGNGIW